MIFLTETAGPISVKHCRIVSYVTLYQNVQAIIIHQKTWPPGGGAYFPIYLYRKLKNLLVRNHWPDFIITWQKMFPW